MLDRLPRVLMFESNPGSTRAMRGLIEGREAQAIATFISIPDQIPAFTPSTSSYQSKQRHSSTESNLQVVSVETDIS